MLTTRLLTRRPVQLLVACAAAASLTACQLPHPPGPDSPGAQAMKCDGDLGPAVNTRLAAVEQQIADGKFYAALAELDAIGADNNKSIWLRAEALRRIDRLPEAQVLYARLSTTCMEGRAQHGLGLTWARKQEPLKAIEALTRARQLLPTDPRVRNDLGYAMLMDRRWDDAQFEFLTALDLAPKDQLASGNLVLMAFMQGKADVALSLAERLHLDRATVARLSDRADTLMGRLPPAGRGIAAPPQTEASPLLPPEPAASAPLLTTPASEAS